MNKSLKNRAKTPQGRPTKVYLHSTFLHYIDTSRLISHLCLPFVHGDNPTIKSSTWLSQNVALLHHKIRSSPPVLLLRGSKSRVQGAQLDVGVNHRGVWVRGLDRLGVARLRVAAAARDARLGLVSVDGVVAVQPVHRHRVVVPDAEHQDHLLQRLAHARDAAHRGEVVVVAEYRLLLLAEVVVDVVDRVDTLDLG